MARTRRRRNGFFIIWGSRNRITSDGSGSIQALCPACQRMARIDGMKVQNWFTLYFIPIFPTGSAVHFTQCSACKAQFRASLEEMRRALGGGVPGARGQGQLGGAQGGGYQAAIALFNSMRETPEDSAKLARLLQMYTDMGEPREVISAGRTYGKAMEVSDGCLVLMAEAFMRMGDRESAARHAAAAAALNPNNGKALALQGQAMATA